MSGRTRRPAPPQWEPSAEEITKARRVIDKIAHNQSSSYVVAVTWARGALDRAAEYSDPDARDAQVRSARAMLAAQEHWTPPAERTAETAPADEPQAVQSGRRTPGSVNGEPCEYCKRRNCAGHERLQAAGFDSPLTPGSTS